MDQVSARLNELLVDTYRSIAKVEEAMLKNLSRDQLSITEMHVLESIENAGDAGCTITALAQEFGITLPSVTMTIKRLLKKDYVTKERDATDGRMVCVKLTERGRRAEIAHRYFHRKLVRSILQAIPQSEHDVLIDALVHLQSFLDTKTSDLTVPERMGDDSA